MAADSNTLTSGSEIQDQPLIELPIPTWPAMTFRSIVGVVLMLVLFFLLVFCCGPRLMRFVDWVQAGLQGIVNRAHHSDHVSYWREVENSHPEEEVANKEIFDFLPFLIDFYLQPHTDASIKTCMNTESGLTHEQRLREKSESEANKSPENLQATSRQGKQHEPKASDAHPSVDKVNGENKILLKEIEELRTKQLRGEQENARLKDDAKKTEVANDRKVNHLKSALRLSQEKVRQLENDKKNMSLTQFLKIETETAAPTHDPNIEAKKQSGQVPGPQQKCPPLDETTHGRAPGEKSASVNINGGAKVQETPVTPKTAVNAASSGGQNGQPQNDISSDDSLDHHDDARPSHKRASRSPAGAANSTKASNDNITSFCHFNDAETSDAELSTDDEAYPEASSPGPDSTDVANRLDGKEMQGSRSGKATDHWKGSAPLPSAPESPKFKQPGSASDTVPPNDPSIETVGQPATTHVPLAGALAKIAADRAEFERAFPNGYEIMTTSKQGLLCGIFAVISSMKAQHPFKTPPTETELLNTVKDLRPRWLTEWGLDNTNNFTIDQLGCIMLEWGKRHKLNLTVGYLAETSPTLLLYPDMEGHIDTIWIHNDGKWDRGIGHYSGLRPKENNGPAALKVENGNGFASAPVDSDNHEEPAHGTPAHQETRDTDSAMDEDTKQNQGGPSASLDPSPIGHSGAAVTELPRFSQEDDDDSDDFYSDDKDYIKPQNGMSGNASAPKSAEETKDLNEYLKSLDDGDENEGASDRRDRPPSGNDDGAASSPSSPLSPPPSKIVTPAFSPPTTPVKETVFTKPLPDIDMPDTPPNRNDDGAASSASSPLSPPPSKIVTPAFSPPTTPVKETIFTEPLPDIDMPDRPFEYHTTPEPCVDHAMPDSPNSFEQYREPDVGIEEEDEDVNEHISRSRESSYEYFEIFKPSIKDKAQDIASPGSRSPVLDFDSMDDTGDLPMSDPDDNIAECFEGEFSQLTISSINEDDQNGDSEMPDVADNTAPVAAVPSPAGNSFPISINTGAPAVPVVSRDVQAPFNQGQSNQNTTLNSSQAFLPSTNNAQCIPNLAFNVVHSNHFSSADSSRGVSVQAQASANTSGSEDLVSEDSRMEDIILEDSCMEDVTAVSSEANRAALGSQHIRGQVPSVSTVLFKDSLLTKSSEDNTIGLGDGRTPSTASTSPTQSTPASPFTPLKSKGESSKPAPISSTTPFAPSATSYSSYKSSSPAWTQIGPSMSTPLPPSLLNLPSFFNHPSSPTPPRQGRSSESSRDIYFLPKGDSLSNFETPRPMDMNTSPKQDTGARPISLREYTARRRAQRAQAPAKQPVPSTTNFNPRSLVNGYDSESDADDDDAPISTAKYSLKPPKMPARNPMAPAPGAASTKLPGLFSTSQAITSTSVLPNIDKLSHSRLVGSVSSNVSPEKSPSQDNQGPRSLRDLVAEERKSEDASNTSSGTAQRKRPIPSTATPESDEASTETPNDRLGFKSDIDDNGKTAPFAGTGTSYNYLDFMNYSEDTITMANGKQRKMRTPKAPSFKKYGL